MNLSREQTQRKKDVSVNGQKMNRRAPEQRQIETDRQTDRQQTRKRTDRQMNRQVGRQTNEQNRQTDEPEQTDRRQR
jgi:hypothetical protein